MSNLLQGNQKPDYEDAPYIEAVDRNQMKKVLEKALMHGSEKPILVLTLHKAAFDNAEGDNFLEVMNHLGNSVANLTVTNYVMLWILQITARNRLL